MARAAARDGERDREQHALALARITARRFCRGDCPVEYEELFSAALVGAAQAISRYREGMGAAFATYAVATIRGTVLRCLRDWRPGTVGNPMVCVSLDVAAGTEEDDCDSERERLVDPRADTEREALARVALADWLPLIERLPPWQRRAVWLVDVEGYAVKDVAASFGVCQQTIRNARGQAHVRLREWARVSGLAPGGKRVPFREKRPRARAKPGHATGERNGKATLTDREVQEIRDAYLAGGVSHRSLAARYGVHTSTVGRIVKGERRGAEE